MSNIFRVMTGCLFLSLLQAGCGPRDVTVASPQNVAQEQVTDSVEALEKKLKIISETGEGGSSLEGISESIEKNVADPQAKSSLQKELAKLNNSTDAEQNKKTAERMLKTLKP